MAKIEVNAVVTTADRDGVNRLIRKAMKRHRDPLEAVGAVTMACIYEVMSGLAQAGVPLEESESLILQTINQAKQQLTLNMMANAAGGSA